MPLYYRVLHTKKPRLKPRQIKTCSYCNHTSPSDLEANRIMFGDHQSKNRNYHPNSVRFNQNNRTKYIFVNLRKIDDRNKWKKYFIVTILVIREQPIFIQL